MTCSAENEEALKVLIVDDEPFMRRTIRAVLRAVGRGLFVRPHLPRDEEAVDGVVDERDEDAANLDEDDVRDGLEVSDGVIKVGRAGHRLRVGVEVFKQEEAEREDARQLVKLPENKRTAQTDGHVRVPLLRSLRAAAL